MTLDGTRLRRSPRTGDGDVDARTFSSSGLGTVETEAPDFPDSAPDLPPLPLTPPAPPIARSSSLPTTVGLIGNTPLRPHHIHHTLSRRKSLLNPNAFPPPSPDFATDSVSPPSPQPLSLPPPLPPPLLHLPPRPTVKSRFHLLLTLLVCIGVTLTIMLWVSPFTEPHPHSTNLVQSPATLHNSLSHTNLTYLLTEGDIFDVRIILEETQERVSLTLNLKYGDDGVHCIKPLTFKTSTSSEIEIYKTIVGSSFLPDCPSPPSAPYGGYYITLTSSESIGVNFSLTPLPSWASARVPLAGVLLIVVYVFIILDVIHRTLTAMVGGLIGLSILYALGIPKTIEEVVSYIDVQTLSLLWSMMVMVHLLSTTGVFPRVALKMLIISKGSQRRLLIYLSFATATLSAFLDNVTTMLLVAPVTIELCRLISIDPIPFLVSSVMFSNIGGCSTMIGDPPNIIIGTLLSDYVTFLDFIVNLLPPLLISSVPSIMFLLRVYRRSLSVAPAPYDAAALLKSHPISRPYLLHKTTLILGTTIILFFLEPVHKIPTAWIAIIGAVGTMLVATPHHLHSTFSHVEWDTLLFFAALFVLIATLGELGLIEWIGDRLADLIGLAPPPSQLAVAIVLILWTSAIVSGFLDNIPYTTTMVPIITRIAADLGLPLNPLIWSLAFGACLGGNLTLVGASANLVTAAAAEHGGAKITFTHFMKVGAGVVAITVTVAMGWCLMMYVGVGWQGDTYVAVD